MKYFLDANVYLRHLMNDHKTLSRRAEAIFIRIADSEIQAYSSVLVMHEVTYVLENVYNVHRKDIAKNLKKLFQLPSLNLLELEKKYFFKALSDYKNTKIDFPDCLYKQISITNKLQLVSFDRDFKKLKVNYADRL